MCTASCGVVPQWLSMAWWSKRRGGSFGGSSFVSGAKHCLKYTKATGQSVESLIAVMHLVHRSSEMTAVDVTSQEAVYYHRRTMLAGVLGQLRGQRPQCLAAAVAAASQELRFPAL